MATGIVYPSSRPDRAEASQPVTAVGGASVSLPRSRVWGFLIGCTGPNQRTTIVSQAFQTPCVIWEMNVNWPQAGSGGGGLSLLYSTDNSGAQTNGPAAKPSGTPVFDQAGFRSAAVSEVDTIPEHLSMIGEGGTVTIPLHMVMKYIIDTSGPIYLKLSLQAGAGEIRTRGAVLVFEGASLEQLANFL